LAVNKGQKGKLYLNLVVGKMLFKVNQKQSYYIYLKLGLPDLNLWVENVYDLKDPEFRFFHNIKQNK
jgi:hypothetical protein